MVGMHSIAERAAEKLLTDRVQLVEPKTAATLDRATFAVTLDPDVVLWEGPALFVTAASSRTTNESGGATQEDELDLRLPLEAPAVKPATVAVCIEAADSELVGETFEVLRSGTRSQTILRRYTLVRYSPHSSISTA